MMDSEIVCYKS